jgi:DNA-directed RNA polymerase subunit L
MLELQILAKEGNLIDVNKVLETRTKEITRLRRALTDIVKKLPIQLQQQDENTIRTALNDAVNGILADMAEFIADDWTSEEEEPITEE